MPSTVLSNWIRKIYYSEIDAGDKFRHAAELLGLENFAWVKINRNSVERIITNKKNNDFDIKLSWNNCENYTRGDDIGKNKILFIENIKDNYHLVLGDNIEDVVNELLIIINLVEKEFALKFYENTSKLLTTEDPNKLNIKFDLIPAKFVAAAIPGVVYTVAHEDMGPKFVYTLPEDINKMENLMFPVGIYSTLNSEFIAKMGHVFTSTPTEIPIEGELQSVIFVIPNEDARGFHELHALSVVISQEFSNLTKEYYFQIKSLLYSGVEAIRQLLFQGKYNLVKGDTENTILSISPQLKEILDIMRLQIVSLLTMQLGDEIHKWR